MRELLEWLEGKKTYIGAIVTTVLAILASDKVKELGIIPEHIQGWITLLALLSTGLTVSAHRSALAQVQKSQVKAVEVQRETAADVREAAAEVVSAAKQIAEQPAVDSSAADAPRMPARSSGSSTGFSEPPRFDGGR